MPTPIDFHRWVNDHNPPEKSEYRKGWWDYVEIVQRLMDTHELEQAEVVGTYLMKTPPPKEELLMPVVKLEVRTAVFLLKYDFGVWPERWTLSTTRSAPYTSPTFGLFDAVTDLRSKTVAGFEPEWLYPPYRESPGQFTCELGDEWDVVTFIRLMAYEDV
jgi:hypothetical protein